MERPSQLEAPPAVLVVDDHETAAKTLARSLEAEGFSVQIATSGEDALALALSAKFDIVLLDLHLPEVSGFLVLKALRVRHPQLAVVTMTGWYLKSRHEAEVRALGVYEYLFKPLMDMAAVAATLRAAIASQRRTAPDATGCSQSWGDPDAPQTEAAGEEIISELRSTENTFIRERLPVLQRQMRRAFPRTDEHLILESIGNALVEFLRRLSRGEWSGNGSVRRQLYQMAWRDLRDLVLSAKRRQAREARYAREHSTIQMPEELSAEDPEDFESRIAALGWTDAEREAIRQWVYGAQPRILADALGISALPPEAQVREVKRFKDRIRRRGLRMNREMRPCLPKLAASLERRIGARQSAKRAGDESATRWHRRRSRTARRK